MVRETSVYSQVESYQRLKKWYLILPCLTLSFIRWGSRVKWSIPGNGIVPSPIPHCSSYLKGNLWVTLHYSRQLCLIIDDFSWILSDSKSHKPFRIRLIPIADLSWSQFQFIIGYLVPSIHFSRFFGRIPSLPTITSISSLITTFLAFWYIRDIFQVFQSLLN